ncbi:MAG: flavin reductase family protein, partial [Oscillospiraceae bacterium]|nr:flavin reductase family protein [Oscillospiraceae bacterium]
RYTFNYMEQNEYFTLSFYGGDYKMELGICGSKSGKDTDKTALIGFKPLEVGNSVSFQEAKVTVLLRKIAYQDMKPDGFIAPEIMDNYKASDFHRTYVGEIVKVLVSE